MRIRLLQVFSTGFAVVVVAGCSSSPEIRLRDPFALAPITYGSTGEGRAIGDSGTAAAAAVDGPLSIPALLELARTHNPALRAAAARFEAAGHRARQAGLWPNPRAEFEMDDAPVEGKFFADAAYAFRLSQELPTSGRVDAARQAAEAEARVAAGEWLIASAEVFDTIVRQVIEILSARERLAIAQENLTATERIRDLVARLVDAGTIPGAQRARAQAALGRATNDVEDVTWKLVQARAALADAVGLDAAELPEPPQNLTLAEVDAPPAVADMVRHAIGSASSNAWMTAARSRVEASRQRVIAASAAGGTDLDVTTGIRYAGETDSAQFILGQSFPLRFIDHNQAATAAARADQDAAIADELAAINRTIRRIYQAHAALESTRRQLGVWREDILPASRETVTGAEASVRVAALSALEVLDAQEALYHDRLGELETRRQMWLAALDLQIESGDPAFFNPFQLPGESP